MSRKYWKNIEECQPPEPPTMFIARAILAEGNPHTGNGRAYNSDCYCVWKDKEGFARWPHSFPPTHWCNIPEFDGSDSFYKEYDSVGDEWNVYEVDAVSAEGMELDNLLCTCFTEEEADRVLTALIFCYEEVRT